MQSTKSAALMLLVLASISGCQIGPRFGPQGTIGDQRARAAVSDPFPSNDLGPPIMGGRPLGFDRPRSETTYLQDNPAARRSTQGGFYQPRFGF